LHEEAEHRVQQNGLKYYTPNGKCEEFIRSVSSGQVFIGIFSAANGTGKTALMANILGNLIFDTTNPYFDTGLFRNFRYPHRARIASTKKNVEGTEEGAIGAIQTEIKRWFPKGSYKVSRQGKSYDCLYSAGDWSFDIMTYDQDPKEYEGATLGVMIFDEPPPLKILYACISRMRMGGILLIFMTPLDEGGIILEELTKHATIEYKGQKIGKVVTVYADIEDNCKEHGVRGQLNHEDILKMVTFYDEDEKEARARGRPSYQVGRIYPTFEAESPLVVDDFEIEKTWQRVMLLDPHDGVPFAMTWIAIDETGQAWVYDEFPLDDLSRIKTTNLAYPDYARIIREKEGRLIAHARVIDPFFGNKRYGNTGKTPKEELADLGLEFMDGDTSGLETGHMKVREFLKFDRLQPISSLNHPKLHIFRSCRNNWNSLCKYAKKFNRSGEIRDRIRIDETYKHHPDLIRHFCMKYDEIRGEFYSDPGNIPRSAVEAGQSNYGPGNIPRTAIFVEG